MKKKRYADGGGVSDNYDEDSRQSKIAQEAHIMGKTAREKADREFMKSKESMPFDVEKQYAHGFKAYKNARDEYTREAGRGIQKKKAGGVVYKAGGKVAGKLAKRGYGCVKK